MDSDDDDKRAPRPIDEVFWEAWKKCTDELLVYAMRFFGHDRQAAMDLRDAAFDAVLDGSRPWREGTELVNHMKGCMKSIHWNEGVSISTLVLRQTEEDEDPDPAAPDRLPDEHAIDNARTKVLQSVANDIYAKAREGSLEQGFLRETAKGVESVDAIAKTLGVTKTQVVDARKTVRRKAQELLRKRGYALSDEDEDGDES